MDYAQARYHSSTAGRFTSPDPYLGSAFLASPQSWNRYAYCLNDPVNLIDPSGLVWLTKDNENYEWVDDDKYKEENWKGYTKVEPGRIAYFGEGWGGYQDTYKDLMGSYVRLNANGTLSPAGMRDSDDPGEATEPEPASEAGSGFGLGVTGGGSASLGNILFGAGATGSGFAGQFYDPTSKSFKVTTGAGLAGGANAYMRMSNQDIAAVSAPALERSDQPMTVGASAGVGVGIFLTNAKNVLQLRGPFWTRQLNTPLVSVQYDVSGNVRLLSITAGKGLGASYWSGRTTAVTTQPLPSVPTLLVPRGR